MCGIAGYVGELGDEGLLTQMLDLMQHRGPDARGQFRRPGLALGHNRLSINDLSPLGNQPFVTADGGVALTVNGEIYNYRELRRDLEHRGHQFKSQSDSEVILHGYREYGEDFFSQLNGMFAVALWDDSFRKMILARDRLGIKPMYYAQLPGAFLFASELKAIASCKAVELGIDEQALGEYLTFEHYFGGRTLNREIKMVRPGQIVTFAGSITTHFFWKPEFGKTEPVDVYEAYREHSRTSVKRHLLSDVPIGCYQSAGFDSSIVTFWANHEASKKLSTYTGTFGLPGYFDEAEDASRFAGSMGSPNQRVDIVPADFVECFEKLCWHLDEPRAGFGSFSQFQVARRAAQDVRVVLTGHGGDELFAGYPIYRNLLAFDHPLSFLKRSTPREMAIAACFAFYPLMAKAAKFRMPVVIPPHLWGGVLHGDALAALAETDPCASLQDIRRQSVSPAEEVTRIYLQEYLSSLFVVEDKVGMAFSLESRTPLCDNAMVDLALSIPLETKLKGMELKHIPRRAMKGLLPEGLYHLPKRGFPTPLRHWFKNELKPFVWEFILGGVKNCPMLDERKVIAVVNDFMKSRLPFPFDEILANRIWVIMNLIAHSQVQKRRYGC